MRHHTLQSSDKKTMLHIMTWTPEGAPIAVIQLIHGMAEYIERYHDFAEYLAEIGYFVVGHDHLGHGQSVDLDQPRYGFFAPEESVNHLLNDIQLVRQWASQMNPELPYFMLGHSMGSFALRNYLQKWQGVQGAILMGTGSSPAMLSTILLIVDWLNKKKPNEENKLIDKLAFGAFSKKFSENSSFSWLSKNQENVRSYEADPLTGFVFTNNGFYTLFHLIKEANQKGWAKKLPQDLPVLLVSGEQDPVGDYGKGTTKVAKDLSEAGLKDVTLSLFSNLRHEILLEDEKMDVYHTISNWLEKHHES